MSFWSSITDFLTGDLGGGLLKGLFGLGSSYTSAKMEYSQTKEGQKRQYQYNTKLNKQQYKQQTNLNKQGYNYQTLLNATANKYAKGLMNYESQLTTAQNQWNAVNIPALTRQGYEQAGINPMLSVGASTPTQMIPATGVSGGSAPSGSASGSSISGAQGARVDLLKGVTDAYRTFALDKNKVNAEIANLNANTNNTNAKTITEGYNQKLIDAETQLRFIDKALKAKDLEWYDRVKLAETRSMMINALANETQANAASMQATTARLNYGINKYRAALENYDVRTRRAEAKTHRDQAKINYYKNYHNIKYGQFMDSNPNYYNFVHSPFSYSLSTFHK